MPIRFHLRLPTGWFLYLLGALILAVALVTVIGERGALHVWRLRGEKSQLDEQNYRLQKENEALRQRIARIRHDDQHLEKLAREELNLVRPGDVVYRFPKAEARNNRNSAVNEAAAESPPSKEQRERR
jgi:cell division protein FtsB